MAYEGEWLRLSEALTRVMEAAGISKEEARAEICRAVADRRIRIRGELGRLTTTHTTSAEVLAGKAFEIPTDLGAENLDWAQSCPLGTWFVRRDHFRLQGHWSLEWIELSRADVANVLCARQGQVDPPKVFRLERGTTEKQASTATRAQQAIRQLYPKVCRTKLLNRTRCCAGELADSSEIVGYPTFPTIRF